MKIRPVVWLTGVLLAAAGTAQAHQTARYASHPPNFSGSVTLWSGGRSAAGWAGSLTIGAPVILAAPLVPVVAAPPVYRYVPHRHHGHRSAPHRAHGRPYHRGYEKGWKRAHGNARKHRYND